ncbi:hypothetical protein GF1_19180 [Desulfolithobacter dissulfuricans]|uniref:Uncharacterized protein n=1 Tax=Desulfolithobacter dissulfuricans TaxID=2795293 RepID=A0A915U2W2_9BACT|nr:hypothetical protein GF1_19180 [Desulfolithobacter dissulfuricans]
MEIKGEMVTVEQEKMGTQRKIKTIGGQGKDRIRVGTVISTYAFETSGRPWSGS